MLYGFVRTYAVSFAVSWNSLNGVNCVCMSELQLAKLIDCILRKLFSFNSVLLAHSF